MNIEYPKYSAEALGLLRDLGIDIPRLRKDFDFNWLGSRDALKPALLFNEARYGRDVMLRGVTLDSLEPADLAEQVDAFPLSDDARAKLKAFLLADRDVLAGKSPEEREAYLHGTSYTDFLRQSSACRTKPSRSSAMRRPVFGACRPSISPSRRASGPGLPGAHVVGDWDEPGLEENDRDERCSRTATAPLRGCSCAR